MKKTDCWVIIPAHNERRRIADVIARVRAQGYKNIVVVDDGSKDTTTEAAQDATVLTHVVNLGKGAAMKTGAEYALKHKAKSLIFLDGDGQHKPEDLPVFLRALRMYDVVFSFRRRTKHMPVLRRFGNWMTPGLIDLLFVIKLRDVLCGYRAMTSSAYRKLRWSSRGYTVESEIVARTGRAGLSHTEVEIHTIYHDRYKGMMFTDGLKILAKLLWWRLTL